MSLFLAALLSIATYADDLPHLDLEMTGQEYLPLIEAREQNLPESLLPMSDPLDPILSMGKRNIEWLEVINRGRIDAEKLQLSTPETQVGIPITQPRETNRATIQADFEKLQTVLPEGMKNVLLATSGAYPEQPPVADEDYLTLARQTDKLYQQASRWLLQEPYLQIYASRASNDIRGYYFLALEEDLETKLRNWNAPETPREYLAPLLVGQCYSAGVSLRRCRDILKQKVQRTGSAWDFHLEYRDEAQKLYNSFFELGGRRSDIVWRGSEPAIARMPFQRPNSPAVQTWLTENIEDEWRWTGFNFRLSFKNSGWNLAHIVFVPGATPNVNGLGGNRITMDANRPIDEYQSRWVIRHEFGHVLGYPDCYIEFYDEERGLMVNYQIDTENLMCSRRGKFQQIHFDEFKKNYFKP